MSQYVIMFSHTLLLMHNVVLTYFLSASTKVVVTIYTEMLAIKTTQY